MNGFLQRESKALLQSMAVWHHTWQYVAAEFEIPAAIGCGEKIYDYASAKSTIWNLIVLTV